MQTFELGDNVRLISTDHICSEARVGNKGTVTSQLTSTGDLRVSFDNGNECYFKPKNLELVVSKPTLAERLTKLEKFVAGKLAKAIKETDNEFRRSITIPSMAPRQPRINLDKEIRTILASVVPRDIQIALIKSLFREYHEQLVEESND